MIEAVFNSLSEKNKRLALIGGAAVGGLLILWFGIAQPGFKKMHQFEAEKTGLAEKEPLLRDVLASEARLEGYKKYLAPSRDLAPLIQELATLAEQCSMRVASISPEKGLLQAAEGEVEKLSVAMEAEGAFHDLGDFISRVENLGRFVKVTRVDFGRSGASEDLTASANAKRAVLMLSVFYLPADAPA